MLKVIIDAVSIVSLVMLLVGVVLVVTGAVTHSVPILNVGRVTIGIGGVGALATLLMEK